MIRLKERRVTKLSQIKKKQLQFNLKTCEKKVCKIVYIYFFLHPKGITPSKLVAKL